MKTVFLDKKVTLMIIATLAILSQDSLANSDVNSYTIYAPTTVYGTVMTPTGKLLWYSEFNSDI